MKLITVSGHSRGSFQTCPRSYLLYFLKNLKRKGLASPLWIGSIVHELIEYILKSETTTVTTDLLYKVDEIENREGHKHTVMAHQEEQIKRAVKDFALARGMVIGLVHSGFIRKFLNTYEPVFIEERMHTILEDGTYYSFKPDFVGRHIKQKYHMVADWKTSANPEKAAMDLEERYQLVSYSDGVSELLGVPVDHGLYIVMKKSQIYGRKNETNKALSERISQWYIDNPDFIKQLPVSFDEPLRKRVRRDIKENIWEMKMAHKHNRFPRHESSCIPLGQPWAACQYLELCNNPNKMTLEVYYERRTDTDEYGMEPGSRPDENPVAIRTDEEEG